MNSYEIVLLIRSLFVVGMIGLLVVAGALIARRERRRAATPALRRSDYAEAAVRFGTTPPSGSIGAGGGGRIRRFGLGIQTRAA